MKNKWRSDLLERMRDTFGMNDLTHGLQHALSVEKKVQAITRELGMRGDSVETIILQSAALLHDTGYSEELESWSTGKAEHVASSVKIAREVLSGILPFREDPLLIDSVCYLVFHHDDTNYEVPVLNHGIGEITKPIVPMLEERRINDAVRRNPNLNDLLRILKQADSLDGTSEQGALRTWSYSLERDIPPIAPGNPTSSLCWEESAITNVRLAAKRGLIDSFTLEGRRSAGISYLEVESFIKSICRRNRIAYEGEPSIEKLGLENIRNHGTSERSIIGYRNWDLLRRKIRSAPLNGDNELFPYSGAKVTSALVPIQLLAPLSRYIIKDKLEFQQAIFQSLLTNYAFDLFNLSGILQFYFQDKDGFLAPPVVEQYTETEGEITGEVFSLIDGLHRCYAARELGLSHIRVVLISDVADCFPICPLPLYWDEVSVVDETPDDKKKRKFRYTKKEELANLFERYPDVYDKNQFPSADRHIRYYTYRDLTQIGSPGIR